MEAGLRPVTLNPYNRNQSTFSLWLAFHDDLADPQNDDPVARESTRLYCAAVNGAQVSLDPHEVRADTAESEAPCMRRHPSLGRHVVDLEFADGG